MKLPGGIKIDGAIERNFRFKPVTGFLEVVLWESANRAGSTPSIVTAVLSEALAELGDTAVSTPLVRNLSVGDRQFLMTRLAAPIADQVVWQTAECGQCSDLFDVPMRFAELPAKPAGEHFPETTVDTGCGPLKVRVPTGADQEAIAGVGDETRALNMLLQRIVSSDDPLKSPDLNRLSKAEIDAIETRVEAMAPEMATHLHTRCPSCETENRLSIDCYGALARPVADLYAEVHQIASVYHWRENDILELPRTRRQLYLHLIDESRSMQSRRSFSEAG